MARLNVLELSNDLYPLQEGCRNCQEDRLCAFSTLIPHGVRQEVVRRRKDIYLAKGQILYREGELPVGFWVVCRGQIKVSRFAADGKSLVMQVAQAGDTVGATPFFSKNPYEGCAEALEPTWVAFLHRGVFEELIGINGEFAVSMLRHLANEVSTAESKAVNMAYRSARDRVLAVLLEIHQHDLAHGAEGWSFSLPRKELAEQAGLTVETIVRVLKGLEKEGLLFLDGRRINIADRPQFLAMGVETL